MAGKPDIRLDITNPINKPGAKKTWWAPVGQISLWRGDDGRWSGTCFINVFGKEFKVFEASEKNSVTHTPTEKAEEVPF
jgi:hypothetical protein